MTEKLERDITEMSRRIGATETALEVVKNDVSSLKVSEAAAMGERRRIHEKLEEIHGDVKERDGAEKVRRSFRQWCWDLIKVALGAALGWFGRGGTGGG